MRFASDNLVYIVWEGHAPRRGLGEESFLNLGLKVKRDSHAVPLFSLTRPPYSKPRQTSTPTTT